MHMLLNRTKEHSLKLKQGKILTKGDKPRTGYAGALFPTKEMFQAQDSSLHGQVGVKRPYTWGCLSQQGVLLDIARMPFNKSASTYTLAKGIWMSFSQHH